MHELICPGLRLVLTGGRGRLRTGLRMIGNGGSAAHEQLCCPGLLGPCGVRAPAGGLWEYAAAIYRRAQAV